MSLLLGLGVMSSLGEESGSTGEDVRVSERGEGRLTFCWFDVCGVDDVKTKYRKQGECRN